MKDKARIEHLKNEACTPKGRLIELLYQIEEAGGTKEAKELEKIIIRLEIWQNK